MKSALLQVFFSLAVFHGLSDQDGGSRKGTQNHPSTGLSVPSDAHGRLEEVVIHADAEYEDEAYDSFEDLILSLSPETRILVVCESRAVRWRFRGHLRELDVPNPSRIRYLLVDREITVWARDRYISRSGTLLVPAPWEHVSSHDRTGDCMVPRWIGMQEPDLDESVSQIPIEGGNMIADEERIFVGYSFVQTSCSIGEPEAATRTVALAEEYGKPVHVLGHEDDLLESDHIDMYVTPLGERRALVGDPGLAWQILLKCRELHVDAADWKFSDENRVALDRIADQLKALGYKVTRVPLIESTGGRSPWVTYNNVLMERREGRRVVYLPVYGVEILDRSATELWKGQGFEVRPIRAREISRFGGAVRCVTNVIRREPFAVSSRTDTLVPQAPPDVERLRDSSAAAR